jgi:AraC-like DNA-binding protein
MLAEGRKITDVALESGYSTTSAFISMFKKTLGTTPSRYFKEFDAKGQYTPARTGLMR